MRGPARDLPQQDLPAAATVAATLAPQHPPAAATVAAPLAHDPPWQVVGNVARAVAAPATPQSDTAPLTPWGSLQRSAGLLQQLLQSPEPCEETQRRRQFSLVCEAIRKLGEAAALVDVQSMDVDSPDPVVVALSTPTAATVRGSLLRC